MLFELDRHQSIISLTVKRLVHKGHTFPLLLLIFLVTLVYTKTMPRGLTWEHWGYDAGDLISCVYTFGIPHPPGTPLYVLVGQLFRFLPFFENPAAKFNFMSVFFGCLSLLVTYFSAFKITQSRISSLTAAFFLAFSPLFWGQSIVAEVLTLNLFLVSLLSYFLISWERTDFSGDRDDKFLYLAFFFFGLALTNHTSSFMLSPAILFLIFSVAPNIFRKVKSISRIVLFLLLGLSFYIYLPLRALMRPPLNWGDPSSLSRFISHATAQEYRGMLFFKNQGIVFDNAFKFLTSLWRNFNPFGFLLGILGLTLSKLSEVRKENRIKDFLIFSSLFQLVFVLNYNIVNIESYYLPIFFNFSLFVAGGCLETRCLLQRVRESIDKRISRQFAEIKLWSQSFVVSFGEGFFFFFLGLLPVLGLINLPLNFEGVNLSDEYAAEDYGRGTFKMLEPGAIVLTEGDNYTLGLTYFKYVVFPERTDVAVLHEALFYKLGWMLKQAQRNYPDLKFSQTEVTHNEDEALRALLDFIELNREEHPIYLAVGEPPPRPEVTQRSVYADTYIIQSVGPVFKIIDRK